MSLSSNSNSKLDDAPPFIMGPDGILRITSTFYEAFEQINEEIWLEEKNYKKMEVSVAKDCNCKNEDYFMYVSSDHENEIENTEVFPQIPPECGKIAVNYISFDCKCVRLKCEYNGSNTNDYPFIKSEIKKTIQKQSGKLKGVIFDLFDSNPSKKRYNLCVFWKTFCEEIGVPYQFINSSTLKITSILFGAKNKLGNTSTFDFGKNAMTLVNIEEFDVDSNVFQLEPTFDGLFIKKKYGFDLESDDSDFKRSVMRGRKSANVIISLDDPSKMRDFQNILKPSKIIAVIDKYSNYIVDALKTIIISFYNVGNTLKIVPYFDADLWIMRKQNCFNFEGNYEIKCVQNDETKLPFSKAVDVYVGFKESVSVNFSSCSGHESMETHDLSEFEGSYIRLSLSINANGFYNLNIRKLECSFPLLPQSVEKDAHVHMHLNNKDIDIHAVFGGYGMINDPFDKPSYISFFNEGFPVIGEAAKKLALQHPSFVVYDILNLARMSNVKINPKWGFKVEKDSNGILQIIFDTWRGKRKATPQFLLAVLINRSLNTAKKLLGFRPTVFNIHIHGDFKSAEKAVIQALEILDVQYSVKSVPEKKFIRVEKKILR